MDLNDQSTRQQFRVWDKSNAKMITRHDVDNHIVIGMCGTLYNLQKSICSQNFVVMPWTGLTDNNHTDVYCGDILEQCIDSASYVKIVVQWDALQCGFYYKSQHNMHASFSMPLTKDLINLQNWVVAGNLFDGVSE